MFIATRANINNYGNGMFILECSEKDLEAHDETFGEEATFPYHIDFSFWSTTHDQSSQWK